MNTTPSRIRWRIAPEKSDAEDRQQPEIPDAGTRQVTDKMTVSKGIFQPSHLGSAEAEAWHPDNLAKPGAQPRDDEIEARRIAAELARLHRDGAIASKSAHDPDAVFYARLLRDFGATYTGRERVKAKRTQNPPRWRIHSAEIFGTLSVLNFAARETPSTQPAFSRMIGE